MVPPALRILVLSALLLLAWQREARAEWYSDHEISVELRKDGDLLVEETITIEGPIGDTPLTRSFWLKPAQDAWPLQQSIQDISLQSPDGKVLGFRERHYEDRANIDFLSLPESGVLVLRYRVHRALVFSEHQVNWQWSVTGIDWKGEVRRVTVRATHPASPPINDSAFSYQVGYSGEVQRSSAAAEGAALVWTFEPGAPPDEPISISLDLSRKGLGPVPADWYWKDLAKLTRIPLLTLVLLSLLGLILLISRPKDAIVATRYANFLPGLAAMVSAIGISSYWYFESSHRSSGDDFSGEFIVNVGLAGFILLFAWKQQKTLANRQRAAYFSQFAYPGVLLVAWPLAIVDTGMIIFPLLSFPLYLYWARRKIALEFGVGAYRIAEEVGGRAEVSVAQLAAHFKIRSAALLKALELNPHLPVVVDHKNQMVLSAEAAAMHNEFCVCTYCGGATEVAGMGVQKCGYCARQFTSNKKRKSEKPLPLVIETLAIFFETLASGGYFFAGTIAVAILVMEIVGGSLVGGMIGAVISGGIFSIPAVLMAQLAKSLRKGGGIAATIVLLLLTSWLIAPLLVLRKLYSKRVRFFTGALKTSELESQLKAKGEWSLHEFADYLQSNQEDAAELAQYLAVNQIIDAVYDRRDSRLVHRDLYRSMAKEGSCQRCGGFYGVQSGRATCHFCGHAAE